VDAKEIRLALREAGYHPLPIKPHTKACFLDNWSNKTDATADEIMSWDDGGTGIICGNTIGLDVDIGIPDAAEAVSEFVRDWLDGRGQLLIRTGNAPKLCIPLRTSTPFAKIVRKFKDKNSTKDDRGEEYHHQIEVLAKGQQFVCYGVHPDTGKPYSWHGAELYNTQQADLPMVTEIEVNELLDQITAMLAKEFGFAAGGRATNASANGSNGVDRAGFLDVDSELSDMQFSTTNGTGTRHDIQLQSIASLLRRGTSWDEASAYVLAGTKMRMMAVAPERAAREDWGEQERQIRQMGADHIWKNPELDYTLPTNVQAEFERLRSARQKPRARRNGRGPGWHVREGGVENVAETEVEDGGLPYGWMLYDAKTGIQAHEWLIKGLLPESGVLILSGQWGLYKTTVLLDLAHAVMTGRPFADHFRVKKTGAVMMYALESAKGIPMRLCAVAKSLGDDAATVPFFINDEIPHPLTHPDAARTLIENMKSIDAASRKKFDLPIRMLLIDTYSNAAGHNYSGDDNDRAATQKAFNTMRQISRETGKVVVTVDHYGNMIEAGTTGSAGKEGNADTVLFYRRARNKRCHNQFAYGYSQAARRLRPHTIYMAAKLY
jgi:hypothetical protein